MYLLQAWFNMSDEMAEDSIYDSYAMRSFMGVDFDERQAPDSTTLLRFRHLLEEHGLPERLFKDIARTLEENGCLMRGGTIVDAAIIRAPSSAKNASGERDSEMHSAKKGNDWYFGMKAHIGVDAFSGYTHTLEATAANVRDINKAADLIREDDAVVYGDAGYRGIAKREEIESDEKKAGIDFRVNRNPVGYDKSANNIGRQWEKFIGRQKSSVRRKVEHVFRIVKVTFGYRKAVYRGIKKNLNRLYILFVSANILMYARSGRAEKL
jgi:IS5 family transposase